MEEVNSYSENKTFRIVLHVHGIWKILFDVE